MKAANRKTGALVELAFDEKGRRVEPRRIFQQILENRVRKFGKLHETLHARLQNTAEKKRVPVALWLRSEKALETDEKKKKGPTPRPVAKILKRRKAIDRAVRGFVTQLERRYGDRGFRADALAPVIYADLTREEIVTTTKDPEVLAVYAYEPEGIEDLGDSMAIANADDVHSLGYKGKGIRVAVWENNPDDTSNLSIAGRYKSSGYATSAHARHTHGIVKNIESGKPHGHAPACSLYSANTKDLDALRWAAHDIGCTVISQSFHRSSEPGSSSMSYDDIYKDWLALHWPYPTICQAAGNYWQGDADNIQPPSDEYVNHKGYNGLAVGNHDDNATAMSGDSVFRNPSSAHGDRELPRLLRTAWMSQPLASR